MNTKFRIGILSTFDNPLLSHYLISLVAQDFSEIVVICDSKVISYKDRSIWYQRTGGAFEADNLSICGIQGSLFHFILLSIITTKTRNVLFKACH